MAAGTGDILKARWVTAVGGYSSRTFVEGVVLGSVPRMRWSNQPKYRD